MEILEDIETFFFQFLFFWKIVIFNKKSPNIFAYPGYAIFTIQIKATDTAFSIALLKNKFKTDEDAVTVYNAIKGATRTMDLFQHHDAITGTEKDFVVRDYADMLTKAANAIQGR